MLKGGMAANGIVYTVLTKALFLTPQQNNQQYIKMYDENCLYSWTQLIALPFQM